MTKRGFHKTDIEIAMANILKELKVNFIPEYPIRGSYILDFAVFAEDGTRYDIETDGPCHDDRKNYDRRRDYSLKKKGWKVLRFKPEEITKENVIARMGVT